MTLRLPLLRATPTALVQLTGLCLFLSGLVLPVWAQTKSLVDPPAPNVAGPTGAGDQAAAVAAAINMRQTAQASVTRTAPEAIPGPMPPDPARAGRRVVFGSQMFSGRFASEAFSGFNPDYQIAVGDRVHLRLWGAFNHEAVQTVDAQGNLFVPSLGPLRIQGIRNSELNTAVEAMVKRTFRANVGVYASLEAAQPVKVYVTGYVKAPGLYPGLSSDSVLYYLDRAGGIDPDRGSYLSVKVLRRGQPRADMNLYRFLLDGQIEPLQLQDGDTIVVAPRRHMIGVSGEVLNPYLFEVEQPVTTARALLDIARPLPGATHLSVVRKRGPQRRSEYYPLDQAAAVQVEDGDEVTLTSDKYPGTILVRVEGANLSERTLVLPYGARLKDAMERLRPAPQARVAAVQLFRTSVAERQKQLMESSLRGLETYALTTRSATAEEASLRQKEGQQLLEFINRARQIQPKGQVVLAQVEGAGETLLEDGDVLRVPEQSNLVMVTGEVMVPNALIYNRKASLEDYVRQAGGYTQGADEARVVVVRQDGSVAEGTTAKLQPGDEIMVLPKIAAKSLEVTRSLTQILYQIAVVAKVALGL